MKNKFYSLPDLSYDYGALVPVLSEEQVKIHHQKHHNGYVTNANAILEKFDNARRENTVLDYKAELKSLSFNVGGHTLHTLFWENMAPQREDGGNVMGEIVNKINADFGNFDRFKSEFDAVASGVEGSGWGALVYIPHIDRLMCMPIEKHNVLLMPGVEILLVVDVFEHAYYIDYKNDRGQFIAAFWNIVNWKVVNDRFNMERVSKS